MRTKLRKVRGPRAGPQLRLHLGELRLYPLGIPRRLEPPGHGIGLAGPTQGPPLEELADRLCPGLVPEDLVPGLLDEQLQVGVFGGEGGDGLASGRRSLRGPVLRPGGLGLSSHREHPALHTTGGRLELATELGELVDPDEHLLYLAVHRLRVGQRIDRLVLPSSAERTPGLVLQAGAPQPQFLAPPLQALSAGAELRRAGPHRLYGPYLA